jgi:hypothetical protein
MRSLQGAKGKAKASGAGVTLHPDALQAFANESGISMHGSSEDENTLSLEIELTTLLISQFNKYSELWEAMEVTAILSFNMHKPQRQHVSVSAAGRI